MDKVVSKNLTRWLRQHRSLAKPGRLFVFCRCVINAITDCSKPPATRNNIAGLLLVIFPQIFFFGFAALLLVALFRALLSWVKSSSLLLVRQNPPAFS